MNGGSFGTTGLTLETTLCVKQPGILWWRRVMWLSIFPQGSMESWLLLRSLRTFPLRIVNQSKTATALAQWLNTLATTPEGQECEGVKGGLIAKTWHGSLQGIDADGFDAAKQNEGGWSPCFSILASEVISL